MRGQHAKTCPTSRRADSLFALPWRPERLLPGVLSRPVEPRADSTARRSHSSHLGRWRLG